VFQLVEKDYQTKLDMLFKKHLYDIAINVARSQTGEGENGDSIVEIYKEYASMVPIVTLVANIPRPPLLQGEFRRGYPAVHQDHRPTGAITCYPQIPRLAAHLQLDRLPAGMHAPMLADAQALHERNRADKHHTTLLLNCYTKV
jgi:hypothetical protein